MLTRFGDILSLLWGQSEYVNQEHRVTIEFFFRFR